MQVFTGHVFSFSKLERHARCGFEIHKCKNGQYVQPRCHWIVQVRIKPDEEGVDSRIIALHSSWQSVTLVTMVQKQFAFGPAVFAATYLLVFSVCGDR